LHGFSVSAVTTALTRHALSQIGLRCAIYRVGIGANSHDLGDDILPLSSSMNRLVAGYRAFREGRWQAEHARYVRLAADGQAPGTLVIACSDSRSDPATIFDANPGELFVVRNIAAIVPPLETDAAHHGTTAAIAFAVCVLKVRNILVLGHAQCSGVAAAMDETIGADVPSLRSWIDLLAPAVQRARCTPDGIAALERGTVLLSMERLMTYPFVEDRVRAGDLEINGARFGIGDGVLEIFDPEAQAFLPASPVSPDP
jgi:carbonic anhydrase